MYNVRNMSTQLIMIRNHLLSNPTDDNNHLVLKFGLEAVVDPAMKLYNTLRLGNPSAIGKGRR